jgi:hypothetical protein
MKEITQKFFDFVEITHEDKKLFEKITDLITGVAVGKEFIKLFSDSMKIAVAQQFPAIPGTVTISKPTMIRDENYGISFFIIYTQQTQDIQAKTTDIVGRGYIHAKKLFLYKTIRTPHLDIAIFLQQYFMKLGWNVIIDDGTEEEFLHAD